MWRCYDANMRTTLELDDDVLEIARGLAAHRRQSIGRVISDHFRKSLQSPGQPLVRNGLRIIRREAGAAPVTLEVVNKLRDERI